MSKEDGLGKLHFLKTLSAEDFDVLSRWCGADRALGVALLAASRRAIKLGLKGFAPETLTFSNGKATMFLSHENGGWSSFLVKRGRRSRKAQRIQAASAMRNAKTWLQPLVHLLRKEARKYNNPVAARRAIWAVADEQCGALRGRVGQAAWNRLKQEADLTALTLESLAVSLVREAIPHYSPSVLRKLGRTRLESLK